MADQQTSVPKKKRGPAPTGQGLQIQVRLQPDQLALLDRWIEAQSEPLSRPEALRRLMVRALAEAGIG